VQRNKKGQIPRHFVEGRFRVGSGSGIGLWFGVRVGVSVRVMDG